ncbi:tRNA-dihydrouridine(20) synthase [NAD(P)+]-like isoform X1 [Bradysia coprophila]|uniref:tRNA-dihydrouridine(20) synthase [NAD(P)+]-like isoform X1 n=1 Tax=Bradysia coprophila TaxID=38358 RepID=UPI00187DB4F6|nr:tRNA-dihydrouridine(20) synthase [NAD(P)+]-like isoform X1 [Bradysia coprophila]
MVSERKSMDYRNKLILAPMVRVGTLPFRLLSSRYGADIVYTEELIDWKLLKTTRKINDILGTVDFVDETDGTIVFRTCAEERQKVVLQMGTASAERALQVGKLVENDVAAIDINMGCPKEFSVKGGMGIALLNNAENAKKILKTLVDGLTIPVTCKIRIFPDIERTISLVKEFEAIGISAIAVHGRTRQERPQHKVHADMIRKVAENLDIPVIANGGSNQIKTYDDIFKFKENSGTSSVMVARAAQWNPSIFQNGPLMPLDDVIKELLKLSIEFDNSPSNTKYCVQMMLRELQETPRGKKFLECQTLEEICDIWELGRYCREKQLEYQERGSASRRNVIPGKLLQKQNEDEPAAKKIKFDDDVIERNVAFFRTHYEDVRDLPKSVLHAHAVRNFKPIPVYRTQQQDRLFRTVVEFGKKKYSSLYWEKNKRFAEQGAALVCILNLGLIDEDVLIKKGSILQ